MSKCKQLVLQHIVAWNVEKQIISSFETLIERLCMNILVPIQKLF